uniref:ATP-dependent DNA ligase n=1 Tax=Streptomyces sp. NBC_01562 TaxID=2975879 RepID=UPI002F91BA01
MSVWHVSHETRQSLENDGHRTVLWRTEDGVRLQSRTGRDVTALWRDLAVAAMRLPPGVILDGEAVVYVADNDGSAQISFEAAQSGALSGPRRARELAARHPATYVAFDALAHPGAGTPDLRPRPYVERRQALLDVLAHVGPPIEPVWSTTYQGPAERPLTDDQQRDHRSANDARCCHLVPS